ncbi:hypothetical protein ACHAXA_001099 [Cyclostephanos tholiformis]|uniref:Coenzyme Q-binding protein COQ10 START domain-containing protein n=1 Tax=Cyclostephanos tholiformis TaxID=382380 RepID=A0ABD3RK75_9STRA
MKQMIQHNATTKREQHNMVPSATENGGTRRSIVTMMHHHPTGTSERRASSSSAMPAIITKWMTRCTTASLGGLCLILYTLTGVEAFVVAPFSSSSSSSSRQVVAVDDTLGPTGAVRRSRRPTPDATTTTSLNVWWFGGTPGTSSETSTSGEECELVAVRIDRTSPNSRRISGEIVVTSTIDDVWAILTDYDDLARHVPNLVASRRLTDGGGHPGDGSHRCRLYQRGAQKIVGFEFGADVTMDMTERIVVPRGGVKSSKISVGGTNGGDAVGGGGTERAGGGLFFPEERRIDFRCVDSQFFSEFDGTWRVVEMPDNPFTGESETTVSYTVEVRPKGPVPVAALEWRIREDVPTNLRAVKKAAIEVGMEGVNARRKGVGVGGGRRIGRAFAKLTNNAVGKAPLSSGFADFILDYENETLGAYMD